MGRQWDGPTSLDRLDKEKNAKASDIIHTAIDTPGIPEIELPLCHPSSNLFPLLDGAELLDLSDDIKKHGLLERIWMWDDPENGKVILDGRNRYRACKIAGVEPIEQFYFGDDPISFSISRNLKRRHLTPGQRSAIAHDALPLYEAQAEQRRIEAGKLYGKGHPKTDSKIMAISPEPILASEKAAEATGSTGRAVRAFGRIEREDPELAKQVREGTESIGHADNIISERHKVVDNITTTPKIHKTPKLDPTVRKNKFVNRCPECGISTPVEGVHTFCEALFTHAHFEEVFEYRLKVNENHLREWITERFAPKIQNNTRHKIQGQPIPKSISARRPRKVKK